MDAENESLIFCPLATASKQPFTHCHRRSAERPPGERVHQCSRSAARDNPRSTLEVMLRVIITAEKFLRRNRGSDSSYCAFVLSVYSPCAFIFTIWVKIIESLKTPTTHLYFLFPPTHLIIYKPLTPGISQSE